MSNGSLFYVNAGLETIVDPLGPPVIQNQLLDELRKCDHLVQLDLRYAQMVAGASKMPMNMIWVARNQDEPVSDTDLAAFKDLAWNEFVKKRYLSSVAGTSTVSDTAASMLEIVREMNLQRRRFQIMGLHEQVEASEIHLILHLCQAGILRTDRYRTTANRFRRHDKLFEAFGLAVGAFVCASAPFTLGAATTRYERDLQYEYKKNATALFVYVLQQNNLGMNAPALEEDYVARIARLIVVWPDDEDQTKRRIGFTKGKKKKEDDDDDDDGDFRSELVLSSIATAQDQAERANKLAIKTNAEILSQHEIFVQKLEAKAIEMKNELVSGLAEGQRGIRDIVTEQINSVRTDSVTKCEAVRTDMMGLNTALRHEFDASMANFKQEVSQKINFDLMDFKTKLTIYESKLHGNQSSEHMNVDSGSQNTSGLNDAFQAHVGNMITQHENEIHLVKQRVTAIEAAIPGQASEIANINSKINGKTNEIADINSKIDAVNRVIQGIEDRLNAKIDAVVDGKIVEVNGSIQCTKGEIDKRITAIEKKFDSGFMKKDDFDKLTEKIQTIETELKTNSTNLEELETRIENIPAKDAMSVETQSNLQENAQIMDDAKRLKAELELLIQQAKNSNAAAEEQIKQNNETFNGSKAAFESQINEHIQKLKAEIEKIIHEEKDKCIAMNVTIEEQQASFDQFMDESREQFSALLYENPFRDDATAITPRREYQPSDVIPQSTVPPGGRPKTTPSIRRGPDSGSSERPVSAGSAGRKRQAVGEITKEEEVDPRRQKFAEIVENIISKYLRKHEIENKMREDIRKWFYNNIATSIKVIKPEPTVQPEVDMQDTEPQIIIPDSGLEGRVERLENVVFGREDGDPFFSSGRTAPERADFGGPGPAAVAGGP